MRHNRIIFVEPNLREPTGHVWTGMLALKRYVTVLPNLRRRVHFVCHARASQSVRRGIRGVRPLVESECFEGTSSQLAIRSVHRILREWDLNHTDTIVYLTAHSNELFALAETTRKSGAPRCIAIIHQIKWPVKKGNRKEGLRLCSKKLRDAIRNSLHERLVIACTPVDELQRVLAGRLSCRVIQLPIPFLDPGIAPGTANAKSPYVFLGDGRKEKGLLGILSLIQRDNAVARHMLVQVQRPRYFQRSELKRLFKYVSNMPLLGSNEIIAGSLSVNKYHALIRKSRAILLPYDPAHYHARMSGIAVEAGMAGVPVIASRGTWMSKLIKMGKLSGVDVPYEKEAGASLRNLTRAFRSIERRESFYRRKSASMRYRYLQDYSPRALFRAIED